MKSQKIYYLAKVKYKDGKIDFYGKRQIDISNEKQISKYGFDTAVEAFLKVRKLDRYFKKNHIEYAGIDVTDTARLQNSKDPTALTRSV